MSLAALYEGTADWFLRELGTTLNDYTVARAADGTIKRDRAMIELNVAQAQVQRYLLTHGCPMSTLARKVTLTQDSTDTDVYYLPSRTLAILAVADSANVYYEPIYSRLRSHEVGYLMERTHVSGQAGNRKCLRFWNVAPSASSVYAWVACDPTAMSGGDGTYTSTTISLEAAPDLGYTMPDDDYYIGSDFIITQASSTAQGAIRQGTAYSGDATLAVTVATWATTPTASDDYSTLCDLPRDCWPWIVLEAARRILRVDKTFEDSREDVLAELSNARQEALMGLRKWAQGQGSGAREAIRWEL